MSFEFSCLMSSYDLPRLQGESKYQLVYQLVISGLNGYQQDGTTMPETFEEQGEIIWQHLGSILRYEVQALGHHSTFTARARARAMTASLVS